MGCIRGSYRLDRMQIGRAVTMPAYIDKNSATALDTAFS